MARPSRKFNIATSQSKPSANLSYVLGFDDRLRDDATHAASVLAMQAWL